MRGCYTALMAAVLDPLRTPSTGRTCPLCHKVTNFNGTFQITRGGSTVYLEVPDPYLVLAAVLKKLKVASSPLTSRKPKI